MDQEKQDFIAEMGTRLKAYLHVCSGSREDAEDLWQEVAMKYADKGPAPGPQARAWLFTTARREASNLRRGEGRRRQRHDTYHGIRPVTEPVDPFEGAQKREMISRLDRCLEELEQQMRELVYLKIVEGRTYDDLSGEFDIPRSTVAQRVKQGLVSLNRCVQAGGVL